MTLFTKEVRISNVTIGGNNPLAFIAGPCVIENIDSTIRMAKRLKKITERLDIPFIFKSSYDKANRTSIKSFRGLGLQKGLEVLQKVKDETGLPILSDVHLPQEVTVAAKVLDIIQIPAFLCRQTDLILAVSDTGKPVNIKKGQFLSPQEIKPIIDKVLSRGNQNIMITERGVLFGYNNLVVDMRAIQIIKDFGFPVIYDATHSVQLPGGMGDCSGGQKQYIAPLARAAVAAGCDAIFMEVHESPSNALCDGPNMLQIDEMPELTKTLTQIAKIVNNFSSSKTEN